MGNLIFQMSTSDGGVNTYVMPKGLLIAILCIVAVVSVLFYVLRSVGLYTLAKRQGYKKAFLAWIPFCWVIVTGKLTGSISVFGKTFKNFFVFVFSIVLVNGLIEIATAVMIYFPLAGHMLAGGDVVMSSMTSITSPTFTRGIVIANTVLGYVQDVTSILEIFALISLFFNFFKKYWPERFSMAAILSFLGLFPIFAFVVRKKSAVNYQEWVRARYQSFFAQRQNPYGNPYANPNGTANPQREGQSAGQKSPFEEYEKKTANVDPFEEFSSDEKDEK